MNFTGSNAWYRLSDCGRYSICKVVVYGVERYEVWFKATGGACGFRAVKQNLPSYEAAKAEAANHAELCSSRKEAYA